MSPLRIALLAATACVCLLAAGIFFYQPRSDYAGPIAHGAASTEELLARGEYLVTAGNCASCHTTAGGEFMAGGVAFETPFGRLYSTNITPDAETGIGAWSEQDFVDSMRFGIRPNGEHLYPAFPYTGFSKISDPDLAAMYAYLQRVIPVRQSVPTNELGFPFDRRSLLAFWKFLYLNPGAFEPDSSRSASWNRGAYLVEGLAHCSACHSPRNGLGAERLALAMSGGEYLDRVPGGEHRFWLAPNLTGSDRGLGLWSQEELADYLGTARNAFLESFGPMNEVIMNSTRFLREEDVAAMAEYLKSLPAVDLTVDAVPREQQMGRGRTLYNLHCGTCHLPSGEGDPEMAPRLDRGSLVVQAANPASMINAILYGPELPGPELPQRWREAMEGFQYLLDDEEVAAVASFVRHSWGNAAGAVTPAQVARQR